MFGFEHCQVVNDSRFGIINFARLLLLLFIVITVNVITLGCEVFLGPVN